MRKPKTKIESLDVTSLINSYEAGESQYSIAKKNNISNSFVKNILIKNNIKIREGNQSQKYFCNDEYFSQIDTHEKAYWLGFLSADGSVAKTDNEISIGLAYKDIEHLRKFAKSINSTKEKIFIYDSVVKNKTYKCCKFSFHNAQMKIDLSKHNVIPNKSKILEISENISSQFLNSYLLGIIDGDGCFCMDKENQIHFNLIGSKSEIISIQSILIENCNLSKVKIKQEKRSKEMWYLSYGGNKNIKNIVNYLYKDCNIYLQRKRDIIKHLLTS